MPAPEQPLRTTISAPAEVHPTTPEPIRTVALVSLGCPKNLVDSEKMLGLLAEDGLIPVADHADADAIVINTCGFLEASKEESLDEIRQAAEYKRAGSCKRLVVAGCLVQRHRAKLLDACPDVDALIGVFDRDRIVPAVTGTGTNSGDVAATANADVPLPVYSSIASSAALARRERAIAADGYHESDAARLRLTPRHYAYLRVSEGCNQNCAFCTIPSIRGKMRSKPVAPLLAEARELIADGAFELNLIGQDTTSYGDDTGYAPGLAGMLTELNDLVTTEAGGGWLRLMYAYPSCFTDEMIDAIATLPNVVKYIDMPLQHINDRVLDLMRRRTSRALIEGLLGKLHDKVPGVAIRTTFITGFPTETDAEHRELLRFVENFGFDAMGVFTYSPEPGTPAGTMHTAGDAVPADTALARQEQLMLAQQQVAFRNAAQLAQSNTQLDVLIDTPAEDDDNANAKDTPHTTHTYLGRTYAQAPQVDAQTIVVSAAPLTPGELVPCTVTDSDGYDLVAQPTADLNNNVRLPILS